MKVQEGVSNLTIAMVVAICAAPAATLNIWPRVAQMLAEGISGSQVGIVLLVTVSALGMAAVPFAMKKAENWGFWIICLSFGIGLGILNYAMAVGAVGKVRDGEADANRSKQAAYAALKQEVADAEAARRALPAFTPTTPEMVETGKMAVNLAIQARDQECKIVGDICRARVVQLSTRQSELSVLIRDQAITERAAVLDGSIQKARERLSNTGAVPQYHDAQASRLAGMVTKFIDLGPDAAERVADGIISLLAIAAEAIGLGLPRVIVTALTPVARKEPEIGLLDKGEDAPKGNTPAPAALPKPPAQNIVIAASPAIAPPAPTPVRRATRPRANPSDWKKDSISFKVGGKVNCWNAYETYKKWAEEGRKAPDTFPIFCSTLGLATTEVPPTSSSHFLDVEMPVKLKVVKA